MLVTTSVVLAFVGSSCQSYQVPITYAEPATVKPGPQWVDLGRFADERDGRGTTLGAIRNEFGGSYQGDADAQTGGRAGTQRGRLRAALEGYVGGSGAWSLHHRW